MIEVVWCKDRKEFNFLEQERIKRGFPPFNFKYLFDSDFRVGLGVLLSSNPCHLKGSLQYCKDHIWINLRRKAIVGTLNDYMLELNVHDYEIKKNNKKYLLLL